jgi:hypothetical protein
MQDALLTKIASPESDRCAGDELLGWGTSPNLKCGHDKRQLEMIENDDDDLLL